MNKPPLDFYFEFASPYAYFASLRVEGLCARQGLKFLKDRLGASELGARNRPQRWKYDCLFYMAEFSIHSGCIYAK